MSGGWFLFSQQNVLAIQDYFITLVEHFAGLYDAPQPFPLRVVLLVFDRDASAQRVSDEDRFRKPQFVISIRESNRIDVTRGKSDANGKGHGAVRDPLPKRCSPGELRVNVMWEVVSRVTRMSDNICLGDGTSRGDSLRADYVIFEVFCSHHRCTVLDEGSSLLPPMVEESVWAARLKASLTCGGPRLSPIRAGKGTVMAAIASPCGFNTG